MRCVTFMSKYLLIDWNVNAIYLLKILINDWWKLMQRQTITTLTAVNMEDALLRKSKVLLEKSDKIVKNMKKLVKITPQWILKLVQCHTFVVSKEEKIWAMCARYCNTVRSFAMVLISFVTTRSNAVVYSTYSISNY